VANPQLPGWLAAIAAAAGTGIGAAASKLIDKWRGRSQARAAMQVHEATAADKLVGTAMRLLDQVQEELAGLRVQLGQCRDERRMQEEVVVGLRELIVRLTTERDSLRELLDQATRPR
jgi:hypothetical protein